MGIGSFPGFPPGTRSVPVPGPVLGPLLEAITDMAELKCTLRFLWLVGLQRGQPRSVAASALTQDPVLLASLGSVGAVRQGLDRAVRRGTLLAAADGSGGTLYLLHTQENRRVADAMGPPPPQEADAVEPEAPVPADQPNIFTIYEENIGMVTPLVADELREAEQAYPWPWIEDAFREAVDRNKRSWRYISRILERWATEGRGDGEPGRHSETITAAEYIRRYGLPR